MNPGPSGTKQLLYHLSYHPLTSIKIRLYKTHVKKLRAKMAILRPATSRALLVKIIIHDHSQFGHVQMICILLELIGLLAP